MEAMRGHVSGNGVPQYVVDLPGGGGKVPLLPEYVKEMKDGTLLIKNFQGRVFSYPSGAAGHEHTTPPDAAPD